MTDCPNAEVRDLLPEYAHARLGAVDRARVEAHLAGCAECAAELSLIRAASRALGAAPRVDVARIVAALPAAPAPETAGVTPLAPRRVRRAAPARWGSWRQAAAIAAVAVGAVGLAVVGRQTAPSRPGELSPIVSESLAPGSAVPTESVDVARGESTGAPSGEPAGEPRVVVSSLSGGLGDLSDDALRSLLGEIDDLSGAPGTEPAAVLPVMMIEDQESGS